MHEATPPMNNQDQPEATDNSSPWTDPFTGFVEGDELEGDFALTDLFQTLADEAPEGLEEPEMLECSSEVLSEAPIETTAEVIAEAMTPELMTASDEPIATPTSIATQEVVALPIANLTSEIDEMELAMPAIEATTPSDQAVSYAETVEMQNVEMQNVEMQNVEMQNVEMQNVEMQNNVLNNAPAASEVVTHAEVTPEISESMTPEISAMTHETVAYERLMNEIGSIAPLPEALPESDSATEVPNLTELISLIQELNQCNSVLLDRVSQLEEALEQSQQALGQGLSDGDLAEQQRYQLMQTNSFLRASGEAIAQDQVANLRNQLEFAHQSQQRQQILIETLAEQLESSQERVAQLEREAAVVQQRYNEQSQLLTKAETTCRDLQARLYRQQRYTLQFKSALEKCLEVPDPQYEVTGEEAGANLSGGTNNPSFALPRAQQIQPWSALNPSESVRSPWLKILSDSSPKDVVKDLAEANAGHSLAQGSIDRSTETGQTPIASLKPAPIDLPTFLRELAMSAEITAADEAAASVQDANLVAPINATDVSIAETTDVQQPNSLKHQLDSVIQPLADLIAEAMMMHSRPTEAPAAKAPATQAPATQAQSIAPSDTASTQTDAATPMASAQGENVTLDRPQPPANQVAEPQAVAPAAVDGDLWQDLAQLVNVSTEDVVRASLSGDFAAFESIDFDAIETPVDQQAQSTMQQVQPPQAAIDASVNPASLAQPMKAEVKPEVRPEIKPEVRSEVKPEKKRRSLAMIDLPTFPRPDSPNSLAT